MSGEDTVEEAKHKLATDSAAAIRGLANNIIAGGVVRGKLAHFKNRCREAGLSEAEENEVILEIWRQVRAIV